LGWRRATLTKHGSGRKKVHRMVWPGLRRLPSTSKLG